VHPVRLSITIARPREEVFDYLSDIANHPEFSDHYLVDWRLTREQSSGEGAGARFRVKVPLNRFDWADASLLEVQRPQRIVEVGRMGKYNRIRHLTTWTLDPAAGGQTEVSLEIDTEPALPSDRIMETVGRPFFARGARRALRRLRSILEEDRDRGRRVAVAPR
jgi:uncharacterized protein YndB with AHSA1/START domain